jgi:hypothetical protein
MWASDELSSKWNKKLIINIGIGIGVVLVSSIGAYFYYYFKKKNNSKVKENDAKNIQNNNKIEIKEEKSSPLIDPNLAPTLHPAVIQTKFGTSESPNVKKIFEEITNITIDGFLKGLKSIDDYQQIFLKEKPEKIIKLKQKSKKLLL